jgi:hypothetical protein
VSVGGNDGEEASGVGNTSQPEYDSVSNDANQDITEHEPDFELDTSAATSTERLTKKDECITELKRFFPLTKRPKWGKADKAREYIRYTMDASNGVFELDLRECLRIAQKTMTLEQHNKVESMHSSIVRGLAFAKIYALYNNQTTYTNLKEFWRACKLPCKATFYNYIRFAYLCFALSDEFVCTWDRPATWIIKHLDVLQGAIDEVITNTNLGEFEGEREKIQHNWAKCRHLPFSMLIFQPLESTAAV